MNSIAEIDKNFEITDKIEKNGMVFYDIESDLFSIYGVFKENGKYVRLPSAVSKTVSERVEALNYNTAGGRVRFKTDSKKISIIAKQEYIGKMPHFAFSGSIGFDAYANNIYVGSFIPSIDVISGFESTIEFNNDGVSEITINFPLYSGVSEMLIGIEENTVIEKSSEYPIDKPVVYYGSSITQGGCASRPGNSYQAIVSREFDCDYVNLGFSGNAKAETQIIDYMKSLDMSVFVYDYDHNAPSIEHLAATHEKGFKEIRKQNQKLPIILMSRPKYYLDEDEKKRLEIIKNTYNNAKNSGDKNVYFIDGKTLMETAKDNGTVDNCHPNDLGFYSMAQALIKVFKIIFANFA